VGKFLKYDEPNKEEHY